MLPLWRDQLFIALQPSRVTLARYRPFARAPKERAVVNCDAGEAAPCWAQVVDCLQQQLSDARWHGTDATVVLSNHFVRYCVTPWQDELSNQEEWHAYARYQFITLYGEQAQHWDIRLSPAPRQHDRLACAIDTGLIERLGGLSGIRLRSIQPYLMSAFNHWASKLTRQQFWFAVAEDDRLLLALLRDGQWVVLRNRPLHQPLDEALRVLLEQEALLAGQAAQNTPVFLYAPQHDAFDWPVGSRWDIVTERDAFPNVPAELAMALSGGY